ncbi:MAG: PhzF family phenazine biosynthesis protein [Oscillospiraceae bacterium]|nr:PhzF family phenazine biosynthesis protein [Oscillospiraceae bacterium]
MGKTAYKYFIVDAFAERLFKGNQAGVCLLDDWLDSDVMQSIAAENSLAETAFVARRENHYDIKWFTPEVEVDLCGHATLASAYVVSTFVDKGADTIRFESMSGTLNVSRSGDLFELDFPQRMPKVVEIAEQMGKAIGAPVLEAHLSRDLILLVESEKVVREIEPNFEIMKKMTEYFGIVATAKGEDADFVSRYFTPGAGVPEDSVTGSAHSTLIPFWAQRLDKNEMVAKQLSRRGGTLYCKNCGDRVKIAGRAVLYLQGEIFV